MTTYFGDGAWGTGVHRQLFAAEQDGNWWEMNQRVAALEGADSEVVGISNITVIGNQMKLFLTNGGSFGPFTLPTAVFQPRGEYTPGTAYAYLDLFTVRKYGLYITLRDFVAPQGPFNPAAVDGNGDHLYAVVFGESAWVHDVGFSYPGKPGQGIGEGEVFMEHIFTRAVTISASFEKSLAKLGVAPSSLLMMHITKNDETIGSVTFLPDSRDGVLEWDVPGVQEFEVSDVLGVRRPTLIDATARRLVMTIVTEVV
jgi:hypothetical protein